MQASSRFNIEIWSKLKTFDHDTILSFMHNIYFNVVYILFLLVSIRGCLVCDHTAPHRRCGEPQKTEPPFGWRVKRGCHRNIENKSCHKLWRQKTSPQLRQPQPAALLAWRTVACIQTRSNSWRWCRLLYSIYYWFFIIFSLLFLNQAAAYGQGCS